MGTGFVLDVWPGLVVTARHVIVKPRDIEASRISLVLSAPNSEGELVEVDALGCGYPDAPEVDVGIILIAGAAAQHLQLLEPFPGMGEEISARAGGYPMGARKLTWLDSQVIRTGPVLRERDRPSIIGMSGGPVCTAAGAFGVQSRNDHGDGIASILDFETLNACALHARSFAP
jgi:hypothetical protein